MSNISAISWREQVTFNAELDVYSASSLKQRYEDKRVAPLGHSILISSFPVFVLTP